MATSTSTRPLFLSASLTSNTPTTRLSTSTSFFKAKRNYNRRKLVLSAPASTPAGEIDSFTSQSTGKFQEDQIGKWKHEEEKEEEEVRKSLKDYFEETKVMIRSNGGGPRWFTPLGSGSRLKNSPTLLYLPGIDGMGLGLIRHHYSLRKMFDISCLHIPVEDKTSFTGLVELVERKLKTGRHHSSNRPVYLVGESLGACLALAVAAQNPDIDLVLILVNPGTSFEKSSLQTLTGLLEIIPGQIQLTLPYILSSMTGDAFLKIMDTISKGLPLQQTVGELSKDVVSFSSYLSVLAEMLPRETLLWRLKLLKSGAESTNSRLHAVKAQTLVLSSGKDQFLPSEEESERLRRALPKCDVRRFSDSGHFLLLEDEFNLVTVIKGTCLYRHGKNHDYVSDFIPPTSAEFQKNALDPYRLYMLTTSPVMLSTLEDGKVVRGLAGIPSEGPVLFVGYHMLLGLDLPPLVIEFKLERDILLRGIAHPMMFTRLKDGYLPDLSNYDIVRLIGAVPVSGKYLFKLMSSKAHVLLYPGGMREALHRKGEQHKLFWPEQSEFVRTAARFGAKIIPFGSVGEDDFGEVVFDYDDQMKVPFIRDFILELTSEANKLRSDIDGEVGSQHTHLPGIRPKLPGRYYFHFGKPIETEGMKKERRDREKAQELYLEVKSEVEKCIEFLKEKRKVDPYRNIIARLSYQANHGFDSEVPTFEI